MYLGSHILDIGKLKVYLTIKLGVSSVCNEAFSCCRVSLEEMYNGKTAKLQLSKNVICSMCDG